jgi:hypothetical protein
MEARDNPQFDFGFQIADFGFRHIGMIPWFTEKSQTISGPYDGFLTFLAPRKRPRRAMVMERFFENSPYPFCVYRPIIIIYENSSGKLKKEQRANSKESKEFSLL